MTVPLPFGVGVSGSNIRTPDQRLRVFVSSTLRELADERAAAQIAITRLYLTATMFELGARPHPPRDLYRAYLAQSEVFVGIYCRQYGWVAPGEEVSGLEDEYLLSAGMPKLIYVKAAEDREPRLVELLDRVRADDQASYKPFEATEDDRAARERSAGAPTEPQWVANVENATEVTVEMGTRTRTMTPTVLRAGPQRDSLYRAAREHWPFVLDYEKQTSPPFPVIQLAPID